MIKALTTAVLMFLFLGVEAQTLKPPRLLIGLESGGEVSKTHIKDPATGLKPYLRIVGFTPKLSKWT